ncbi:hypothetical protein [Phyllobacterium leguminum]|uniref:Uncharacterized protein n=1 Tax=Phyllobacterium leguminum TaxID=314237 RepID=A0A318T825_9HYPH|nr:hypothetical protein [Phyllobacterium leguminum]PYE89341.1 hypothetical protein C7477_104181 [Phyllobacterium leguminum]
MNSRTEKRLGIAAAAALTVAALIAPASADRSPHSAASLSAHNSGVVQFAYAEQSDGNRAVGQ